VKYIGLIGMCLLLGGCDLLVKQRQQESRVIYQTEQVTISAPTRINAEEIFTFNLKFGGSAEQVRAKLVSQSMSMGVVPLSLTAVAPNHFRAQTLVGKCSETKMVWQLELSWLENGHPRLAQLPIDIYR